MNIKKWKKELIYKDNFPKSGKLFLYIKIELNFNTYTFYHTAIYYGKGGEMMACERIAPVVSQSSNRNFILDTIRKIDQQQKEVFLENDCIGCDGGLLSRMYNTKPISLTMCCGSALEQKVGLTGNTTDLYRIEEVRGTDVILRLLVNDCGQITCTPYTCIFDVNCCCCLQCFEPINCGPCCQSIAA